MGEIPVEIRRREKPNTILNTYVLTGSQICSDAFVTPRKESPEIYLLRSRGEKGVHISFFSQNHGIRC
jgi:hypothetical protein